MILKKILFKLMINSVYGKTMENLPKRINVRLVNNAEGFLKYTSSSTYIAYKSFGKGYTAIHEVKPVLILNKPIYVGFTVAELSKWLTCDFHYNLIKNILMLNYYFNVIYRHRQSCLWNEIRKCLWKILKWKDLFDFCNYPKDSKIFDVINKNLLGK